MRIVPSASDASAGASESTYPSDLLKSTGDGGWLLLNSSEFECIWTGGPGPEDLSFSDAAEQCGLAAERNGIIAWQLPVLIQTPPHVRVRLRGPLNLPKVGAYPLDALVESECEPAIVVMRWKMLVPGIPVRFTPGEPIAMIYPEVRSVPRTVRLGILGDRDLPPEFHVAPKFAGVDSRKGHAGRREGVSDRDERTTPGQRDGKTYKAATSGAGREAPVPDSSLSAADGPEGFASASPSPKYSSSPAGSGVQFQPRESRAELSPREKSACMQNDFLQLQDASRLWNALKQSAVPGEGTVRKHPLRYAYIPDLCCCLEAPAEELLGADDLLAFLGRLRAWGERTLGTLHATTPMLRVYVRHGYRVLSQEAVQAKWRYIYSLRGPSCHARGDLILTPSVREDAVAMPAILRTQRICLEANELVAWPAGWAYGIEARKAGSNPLDGVTVLDGYLW